MESLNTILLGTISALLGITLYVLSGMNDKIKELKIDLNNRLDKIDRDIDTIWSNIRTNTNKLTIVETRCRTNHGDF